MMKKLVALLLAMLMLACTTVSLAEDLTAQIEATFEGVWVQFEDGFEIYLPAEWLQVELTEEMIANSTFYAAVSPDMTQSVEIGWTGLEADADLHALAAELAATYADAQVLNINGIEMLMYTDTDFNALVLMACDAVEPGLYIFALTPADDEAFVEIGTAIALSIRNIEE